MKSKVTTQELIEENPRMQRAARVLRVATKIARLTRAVPRDEANEALAMATREVNAPAIDS